MKFKNIQEIRKYYENQLKRNNMDAFKDIKSSNTTVVTDEILVAEARRLRECIQKHIDEYYQYYKPVRYNRTYGLQKALQVETMVKRSGNNRYIGLYFIDGYSWGRSVVTGEVNGYKPFLINYGWKDDRATPHFDGYEGFHFIEKGIAEWKAGLRYPIDVKQKGVAADWL